MRVLIADDIPDEIAVLGALLRTDGYEVQTAYDGTQALMAAHEFAPHVALLDIAMPGMDGFAVAREIKESFGDRIVLVAITAHSKADDRTAMKAAGFDYQFGKPFSPEELLNLLRTLASR